MGSIVRPAKFLQRNRRSAEFVDALRRELLFHSLCAQTGIDPARFNAVGTDAMLAGFFGHAPHQHFDRCLGRCRHDVSFEHTHHCRGDDSDQVAATLFAKLLHRTLNQVEGTIDVRVDDVFPLDPGGISPILEKSKRGPAAHTTWAM